jgi:hypothetical protein
MSETAAARFGVDPARRFRYVVLDDSKSNHSAITPGGRWFFKEGVTVSTGESIVAVRPVEPGELVERFASDGDAIAAEIAAIARASNQAEFSVNEIARRLVELPAFRDRRNSKGEPGASFRETVFARLVKGVTVGDRRISATEGSRPGMHGRKWIIVSPATEAVAESVTPDRLFELSE